MAGRKSVMKYRDPLGLSKEQGSGVDISKGAADTVEIKSHSGKVIQGISTIILLIGTISALLLAIMVGTIISSITDLEEVGVFLCGTVVFAIGVLFAWIGTRIIRGFGEVVENTAEIATYLKLLCRMSHEEK